MVTKIVPESAIKVAPSRIQTRNRTQSDEEDSQIDDDNEDEDDCCCRITAKTFPRAPANERKETNEPNASRNRSGKDRHIFS